MNLRVPIVFPARRLNVSFSKASFWHYFLVIIVMSNKSSKSPSGENREEKNEHIRDQEIEKKDVQQKNGHIKSGVSRQGLQENLSNRGYQEDQPHQPVRTSGSTKKDQESLPTGEPDANGN